MSFKAIVLAAFLFSAVSAEAKILGWIPQLMTEDQAEGAVIKNANEFVSDVSSCDLESIGFFEATNHLKDIKGQPVLVITSEVELSGSKCQLNKYADCRTVFKKDGNSWTHDITFCENQDSAARD